MTRDRIGLPERGGLIVGDRLPDVAGGTDFKVVPCPWRATADWFGLVRSGRHRTRTPLEGSLSRRGATNDDDFGAGERDTGDAVASARWRAAEPLRVRAGPARRSRCPGGCVTRCAQSLPRSSPPSRFCERAAQTHIALTSGGQGIGRATVDLARSGCSVVVVSRAREQPEATIVEDERRRCAHHNLGTPGRSWDFSYTSAVTRRQ
jgi:hypothetical protein